MKMQILSKNDIERIHKASLKVLEKTGAQFRNSKALDYLEKYGCAVDRKAQTARMPEAVINEFMKKALPESPFYNRDLKSIPKREVYFQTFGTGTYITNRKGEAHPSTLKDVEKVSIVGNALPAIDLPTIAVAPRDVHPENERLYAALANWNAVSNPNKAVYILSSSGKTTKFAVEMASALAGGIEELRKTPIVFGGGCPTSPLVWPGPCLDSMMVAAEEGMITMGLSMATAGSMAPMSLAGTLVVWAAEELSFEVFSQIVAHDAGFKGIAARMGCSSSIVDVRKGYYPVGNPEMALLNAAAMELAQYYKCPNTSAGA